MRAQSERMWIVGLGAVAAALLIALVLVIVVGGGDDEANSPAVSISNLSAVGYDVVLDFTVVGTVDPSDISIDWGDGSRPLALRGSGQLSASHTFAAEPVERIVVVTVTGSDGSVLRASRSIGLGGGGGAADTSTTTTEDPDGSTTTTEDPDGSTTTTSTTGPTTTTTTTPERPTIALALDPAEASFVDLGSGDGSAQLQGRKVLISAVTTGLAGEAVRTATLTWRFPGAVIEGLEGPYQVRVRLEPEWEVMLQASVNRGRAARFFVDLSAVVGGSDIGTASDARSVGNGENETFYSPDVLGFGTSLDSPSGTIEVTLDITCQAVPGSTIFQINERSTCDASQNGRGFVVGLARIQFIPVD